MRRIFVSTAVVWLMVTAGCGRTPAEQKPPAATAPGDAKELKRLEDLPSAEALPALDAYVKKYPNDPNGHWQLAFTLQDSTKTVADLPPASKANLQRAAEHYRKMFELSSDPKLRTEANGGLLNIYGPFLLNQPENVIEPARQLIAASDFSMQPQFLLSSALMNLHRSDEAVQVWVDAGKTLRGRDRYLIAHGIHSVNDIHHGLTAAQVQTLIGVLNDAAADKATPDPRAKAVALELQAEYLEKDPAAKRALLQEAAPWQALADARAQKSLEELEAAIAELERRSAQKQK
jgi:hypothetical protein